MPRQSSSAVPSGADLARRVAAVRAALTQERERFLREGTIADAFGMAYFHVTERVLTQRAFRYPEVIHADVVGFHTAYTQRESLPHWRPYLEAIRNRRLRHGTDPGDLLRVILERGMVAHIVYDLPPVLVATRPPERTWEELQPDFYALDPIFDRAFHATCEDLGRVTGRVCGALRTTHRETLELGNWLLGRFGGGTAQQRRLRHTAWKNAVSGHVLAENVVQ